MKLGKQISLLLDTCLKHFRTHGWLMITLAMLWAVSKWTITYIMAYIKIQTAAMTIISIIVALVLIFVAVSCQAGLLIQANSLLNYQWVGFGEAFQGGSRKVIKIVITTLLVFTVFCLGIFSLTYGAALLVGGSTIGGFFATVAITTIAIYAILRFSFLVPALVISDASPFRALQISLRLTRSLRQLTYTFIGFTLVSLIIFALITLPWFLLWGGGWLIFGKELAAATVVPSANNIVMPVFFSFCNMLIESWSVPLFFLVIVAMYNELLDETA